MREGIRYKKQPIAYCKPPLAVVTFSWLHVLQRSFQSATTHVDNPEKLEDAQNNVVGDEGLIPSLDQLCLHRNSCSSQDGGKIDIPKEFLELPSLLHGKPVLPKLGQDRCG